MIKSLSILLLSATILLTGCGGGDNGKQELLSTVEQKGETVNNKAPIVNINANKTFVTTGEQIDFNANGSSDTDGEIVSYEWIDSDGKIISQNQNITIIYNTSGKYSNTLKITDDEGKSSRQTITITVIEKRDTTIPNISPVAKAQISETEIFTGEGVSFTSNGSNDPDGEIVAYEWRDLDGILLSTEASFSRGFPYAGTYTKTLTVWDNYGATHSSSVTLVVKEKLLTILNINSAQNIAGYEVELKFIKNLPNSSNFILDNTFLTTTGRTVNDLGIDIKSSDKTIKFGAYSYGDGQGVSGKFDILSVKTEDLISDILIVEQICVDKDNNEITCNAKLEKK